MMERYAAADRVSLYVARALALADVREPIDRVAVLGLVCERLQESLDSAVEQSVQDGISYAELGRLLNVSRQAVRQRHRRHAR